MDAKRNVESAVEVDGMGCRTKTREEKREVRKGAMAYEGGDGTKEVSRLDEERFMRWLKENGAKFPKIVWPARTTVQGVRGTVAIDDIESGEVMLEIPLKLMICPQNCRASKRIGHVFAETSLFQYGEVGSDLISVFLMHEKILGVESFWYPYIKMLPDPATICKWSDAQLKELQDDSLVRTARTKRNRSRLRYLRLFNRLRNRFPEDFPEDTYTEDLFRWASLTVAARAFGRRLDYMALVPFADNLNHSNVQTKYDFDFEENGVFRLFPTGSNRYRKGHEVFNSYGRRDNAHLLLHYGFAMAHNEHDRLPIAVEVSDAAPAMEDRVMLLRRAKIYRREVFRLRSDRFEWGTLLFHRVAVLSASAASDLADSARSSDDGGSLMMRSPLGLEAEARALRATVRYYRTFLASEFPTTIVEDANLLAEKDLNMELRQAVCYRITRKAIVHKNLRVLQIMISVVTAMLSADINGDGGASEKVKDAISTLKGHVSSLRETGMFDAWIGELRRPTPGLSL